MIHTYLAHSQQDTEANLGKAYNDFMKLIPDNDWVCFLDSDATWTTRSWYRDMEQIIQNNSEYSLFTCMTNRIGCPYQKFDNVDQNNHDIQYHRQIGSAAKKQFGTNVLDITEAVPPLSGVMMLIQKNTWKKIKGCPDGFLGVDNEIHIRVKNSGLKVGLANGLYVYHFYRADNQHIGSINNDIFKKNYNETNISSFS